METAIIEIAIFLIINHCVIISIEMVTKSIITLIRSDVNNIRSIFNYNDLKSKKLDALLVSTADLIVSTPSGVGATGVYLD